MGILGKAFAVGAAAAVVPAAFTWNLIRPVYAVVPKSNTTFSAVFKEGRHADVCEVRTTRPNVNVVTYAQAFFNSMALGNERKLLAFLKVGDAKTNEEVAKMQFDIGDQIGPFRVVARAENEILFCWDEKIGGYSWLSVAEDGEKLQFGSALDNSPIVKAALPFHLIYARVCIAAAKKKLERM